ncbi:hypothetical protein DW738_01020 [Streptococcus sp. AM28-20]|nr:hypothetical protein DW738_01020 [Streptococcus sp. AM28-20]
MTRYVFISFLLQILMKTFLLLERISGRNAEKKTSSLTKGEKPRYHLHSMNLSFFIRLCNCSIE